MDAYIYKAALYCEECAEAIKQRFVDLGAPGSLDSDDYPQGPYSDGGGEADSPQHCDVCNVHLQNPLTTAGEAYVRKNYDKHSAHGRVEKAWREYYSYLFADEPRETQIIRVQTQRSIEALAIWDATETAGKLVFFADEKTLEVENVTADDMIRIANFLNDIAARIKL